jgi:hypothetical protein
MLKHIKNRPYIRRVRVTDKADDFRTAIRLAFYSEIKKTGFVLAQRGQKDVVIAVAKTKQELMRLFEVENRRDWRTVQRRIQQFGILRE